MSRLLFAGAAMYVAGCGGAVAGNAAGPPDATSEIGAGGGFWTGSGSGTSGDPSPRADAPSQPPSRTTDFDAGRGASIESGPPKPDADVPLAVVYRLAVAARYGVPVADGTGVACDGSHVWLMAGGHNAAVHTLTYAELATGAVSKSFEFANLIEQLGTGVYGITQLADSVFISVAGNTNKIVRVDAATGKIVGQFAAPTNLGPSDLEVSDGHLVESSGTGEVFTLDAQTGAVLGQFAAGNFGRDDGIAIRGNEAFIGSLFGGLDVYDLTRGAPIGHVTKQDGSELEPEKDVGPMCFNGTKLLVLSRLGLTEYEVRAAGR